MAHLKEADFYYGSILSHLFNKRICPMLIEGGDDRQIYQFTTNDTEFKLFTKYRSISISSKKEDYNSWQFVFSTDDIIELNQMLSDDHELSLGLVCGTKALNKSEIAFIHKDEIKEILSSGKTTITISRKKGEKAFRVSRGGGRENAMQIPSNRVY